MATNFTHVLIVDDDEITRMLGSEFLRQAGFTVVEAADGLEALERFAEAIPDIVLLDVEMPRLDGYQTCHRLRELPGGAALPVLMLTGLHDSASIDRAYESGATDFAVKPINWPLICHRVRYMLKASRTFEQLEKSRVSLASSQRLAGLGNWEWHSGAEAIVVSEHLVELWGLTTRTRAITLEELLTNVHSEDRQRVANWIDAAGGAETARDIEHRIVTDSGEERYVRQRIECRHESDGRKRHLLAAVQDVTAQRRAETKIRQLAYFDGLTLLPNRELFTQRLEESLARNSYEQKSVAVMFLDLDDFKRVNDTLGHACGDQLLAQVAQRLTDSVNTDEIERVVARMGGDEFTILLGGLNAIQESRTVAERILESVALPYRINGADVFTTPSLGIALYPDHAQSATELLKKADMAMYRAKHEGKNLCRLYNESMDADVKRRYFMESRLRGALARGDLCLHYQPQMNLQNGQVEAVEALLRWNDSELGDVSPIDFIPLAEDCGLILSIGEWVLRKACWQVQHWRANGLPSLRVAVNISVLQFVQSGFPELVTSALSDAALEPQALELEITESLLAANTQRAVATLVRLKDIGVQLSIDDFGTGYSSLSQLKHFPVDRLKIDQSFIRGVTANAHDAAIVDAVLTMAASMSLRVIAEGVETLEQMLHLERRHCDEIQGYWLSRPLPPEQLEQWFHRIPDIRLEQPHLDKLTRSAHGVLTGQIVHAADAANDGRKAS